MRSEKRKKKKSSRLRWKTGKVTRSVRSAAIRHAVEVDSKGVEGATKKKQKKKQEKRNVRHVKIT